jgi:hypothetical protein
MRLRNARCVSDDTMITCLAVHTQLRACMHACTPGGPDKAGTAAIEQER